MNTAMYENPIVQDNIKKLLSYGYEVLTPASGYLACGDTGAGKMPEPETLLEYILKYLGLHKRTGQFLCGFSMETKDMIGNSRAKLEKKNLDMVAANNLKVEGAGFQGDTNVLTLITQDEEVSLPLMSKEDAALKILDKILALITCRNTTK